MSAEALGAPSSSFLLHCALTVALAPCHPVGWDIREITGPMVDGRQGYSCHSINIVFERRFCLDDVELGSNDLGRCQKR